MNDAAAAPRPERKGFLAAIPAGGLWLAANLSLLASILAVAAWLLWGRTAPIVERILPAPPAELAPDVQARAAALVQEIEALAAEIAAARRAALSFACPPGRILRQGALPGGAPAGGAVQPAATAIPGQAVPPLATLGSGALAERLEQATALVVSGGSIGTGFFVAPDLLLTNSHVVTGAEEGRVLLASRALGGVRRGVVLRLTPAGSPGEADLGLVRLLDGVAPASLALAAQVPKLTAVVAAGYPGLTLQNDNGFRRLLAGDAAAAPDLNLTQAVVQSIQDSPQGVPVLVHTASVLQGNSGGPLVDGCGRAVGVNSFVAVDAAQAGRVSYAQGAGAIGRFLAESGAAAAIDRRPCPQP